MVKGVVEEFFDSLAPNWDAIENCPKERKVELLRKVGLTKGSKVLDVACGTGVITSIIHEFTESNVDGIDISSNMIEIAKEKYKNDAWASFRHIDIFNLEENEQYDFAIIYNAYPHFLSPEKLGEKLSKIIKKNGKFAILHSLSRAQLSAHHSGKASVVSRDLLPPSLEAIYFSSYFDIEVKEESDNSFVLIGKRK